jgi:hypothetical protein
LIGTRALWGTCHEPILSLTPWLPQVIKRNISRQTDKMLKLKIDEQMTRVDMQALWETGDLWSDDALSAADAADAPEDPDEDPDFLFEYLSDHSGVNTVAAVCLLPTDLANFRVCEFAVRSGICPVIVRLHSTRWAETFATIGAVVVYPFSFVAQTLFRAVLTPFGKPFAPLDGPINPENVVKIIHGKEHQDLAKLVAPEHDHDTPPPDLMSEMLRGMLPRPQDILYAPKALFNLFKTQQSVAPESSRYQFLDDFVEEEEANLDAERAAFGAGMTAMESYKGRK